MTLVPDLTNSLSFKNEETIIFNIQDYCVDDGPGIRTSIFFKGCSLRCRWCSNPESQIFEPEILYSGIKCEKCRKCEKACPYFSIDFSNLEFPFFNRTNCSICESKICTKTCPENALRTVGYPITVLDLFERVKKNSLLFRNSGGGITLSGGEPLAHTDFIREFLKKTMAIGFSVGVETCGFFNWEKVVDFIPNIDFFFFDLKIMDSKVHKVLTGVNNEKIHLNLKKLSQSEVKKITVSVPIVPGINDYLENIKRTINLCTEFGIKKIRFLKYHEWGRSKYEELGRPYLLNKKLKLQENDLKTFEILAREAGLQVTLI
ncbi:MAG: glycyl-radical enzyme activating protein [Candidatus Hodarchaeales archaeon]|jgi:pyruvate formate lyase activating enzyme